MNREIIFNAWIPALEYMIEGVAVGNGGTIGFPSDDEGLYEALKAKGFDPDEDNIPDWLYDTGEDWYHITEDPYFILLQFIGVKDKNDNQIFEGDIVEAWSAGSKGVFEIKWRQGGAPMWLLYPNFQHREHWHIHATEYGNGKILIDVSGKITGKNKVGFYDDGLEVIGNIYENPELLNIPKS